MFKKKKVENNIQYFSALNVCKTILYNQFVIDFLYLILKKTVMNSKIMFLF